MEADAMISLYACPVCKAEPECGAEQWETGTVYVARCLCRMAVGRSWADLMRRWNRLSCSDDPATPEDCL